jgi:hypothetical protein
MKSGVPLETCWVFNKLWNNKFYYKAASCWLFLLIHTAMHGSMNIKKISRGYIQRIWFYAFINISKDNEQMTAQLGKAILVQACRVPECSGNLRLPDFMTIGTCRWQGCPLYAPATFTPLTKYISGTHIIILRPKGLCHWEVNPRPSSL